MRAPSHPALLATEVREAARERGALLIMADFDGTLTPIANTPGEARLAPTARRILARLATAPGVGLAVISGRDLPDITSRMDLPGIIHAGCHGLIIEGPGMSFTHLQAAECRQILKSLAGDLVERLSGLRGVEVEPAARTRRTSPRCTSRWRKPARLTLRI